MQYKCLKCVGQVKRVIDLLTTRASLWSNIAHSLSNQSFRKVMLADKNLAIEFQSLLVFNYKADLHPSTCLSKPISFKPSFSPSLAVYVQCHLCTSAVEHAYGS